MQSKLILTILAAFVAATTAVPTEPEPAPLELVKRACPSSRKIEFQGGSCSAVWRGRCHTACLGKSLSQGCCPGTVSSKIDAPWGRCFPGWSTCECSCMKR